MLAFTLHAVALHEGDLTLVQPLLVTVILFVLPASRAVAGIPITPGEYGWATLLLLGLAAFFVAARPSSQTKTGLDAGPAVLAVVIGGLAVLLCVTLARRRSGSPAAAFFGAAAGIAFAGVAALVKVATDLLAQGPGVVLASWQLYALIGVGAAAVALNQLAYRAGPLSACLPALNSVNPIASVLIGTAVFDERIRTGLAASVIEGLALTAVTVSVVTLSRRRSSSPHDTRPDLVRSRRGSA